MSYQGTATSGNLFYSTNDNVVFNYGEIRGDVSGVIGATLVERIRNVPVAPSGQFKQGQIFIYDGGQVATSGIPAAQATPHEILSSTHSDASVAVAKSRGALIHASGAGPTWAVLPLGLNGQVPQSAAPDIVYDYLGANTPFKDGTLAAPAVAFQADPDTGWSRPGANRMSASVSGTEMVRLDGPNGSISLLGGLIYKYRVISANADITPADHVLLVNNNCAVTLPVAPSGGEAHIIKNRDGLASQSAPVTIIGNGKTIDGNGNILIRNPYGSVTLMYNATAWHIL